jgi:hypothetical protein
MISGTPAFAEFRLEPLENKVLQTELGTLIVASRVDGDGRWTATIRALDTTGSRFLGGGHRILLQPLGNAHEPAVVGRLLQGKVVLRGLSGVPHRVRFTPHSSSYQRVTVSSRAALSPLSRSSQRDAGPRWYRAPDPAIRLRVEEDSTGTTIDVYASASSDRDVVLVVRGHKYRLSLQPNEEHLHGVLQVGYQIGDDLYIGNSR